MRAEDEVWSLWGEWNRKLGFLGKGSGDGLGIAGWDIAGRKTVERVGVVVDRQDHLLHIVDALGATSRFTNLLYGRQQQCGQHRDDRDHYQQFNQRKARPSCGRKGL